MVDEIAKTARLFSVTPNPRQNAVRLYTKRPRLQSLLFALFVVSMTSPVRAAEVPTPVKQRDWALFKSLTADGTAYFAPIFGVGGGAIAVGYAQKTSISYTDMYVDKNTYRREGSMISFDMVWTFPHIQKSRLHRNVQIDCSTRTYIMPTWQRFSSPMATGEPDNAEKPYMKKWKSTGDLKADGLAYFCEGPSRSAVG